MKELLMQAREEIISLRRSNQVLGAKVEMIDFFSLVLRTQPAYRQEGFAEDVAWAIQKEIDAIEKKEKELPQSAT